MNTLHRSPKVTALVPKYVSRFHCIGPVCEDNCCTGWGISIDKKTYKAYQQVRDEVLVTPIKQKIKRLPTPSQDTQQYARFELDPVTLECPMFHKGLCSVHQRLGESYLSHTCFDYPRQTHQLGQQHEQALMLSCPEAARQALLTPDAMDFMEHTVAVRNDTVDKVPPRMGLSLDAMNELRIFAVQLMRIEGTDLWQRLALLGMFCEQLTHTLQTQGPGEVPALIETFTAVVARGVVLNALQELQPNHTVQARFFTAFLQHKKKEATSKQQLEVLGATALGLGGDKDTKILNSETLVQHYTQGVQKLPEALQQAPHLLEHYLLNEMFREVFPFGTATPYDHYLRLVSRFGMVRLMLAARCNAQATLPSAAELVQTVFVFCRRFQHDPGFANQVNTVLKEAGWSDLEKIYSFLRS